MAANKDDLSTDHLDEANVMVFGGPREKYACFVLKINFELLLM